MSSRQGVVLLALIVPALAAQQPQAPTVEMRDGGVSVVEVRKGTVAEVLQSIYIPAVKNAPFSAIVHTEWVRALPDGGTYTLVNQRPIARDSDGRIYEERWTLVPRGGNIQSQMTTIQIGDPNLHTLYNCFAVSKPRRCTLETFNETTTALYKPAIVKSGPLPHNAGTSTYEDLGSQSIEGLETSGTRDTITYNEGYFGNDRPVTGTREFWYAAGLGINLRSEVADPTFGKQVFTITDVRLGEPDPGLYQLPQGYQVVDRRKPPVDQPQ